MITWAYVNICKQLKLSFGPMSFKFDLSSDSIADNENINRKDQPEKYGEQSEVIAKEIQVCVDTWQDFVEKKTVKYNLGRGKTLIGGGKTLIGGGKTLIGSGKTLTCISPGCVEQDLKHSACGNSAIVEALETDTDLVPHVYEGGLKVWECSIDLADFLLEQDLQLQGLQILEIGCGSGLPGLCALALGASIVHFQDYNEEVIHRLTIPNVVLNGGVNDLKKCRFICGDWTSTKKLILQTSSSSDEKYDVILTSETIYSPDSYRKLHDVIASLLKPAGVVYLSAKTCYFGVGGGTREFEEYVLLEAVFDLVVVKAFTEGIHREILKLTFKAGHNIEQF